MAGRIRFNPPLPTLKDVDLQRHAMAAVIKVKNKHSIILFIYLFHFFEKTDCFILSGRLLETKGL